MTPLDDEQLEEILAGRATAPEDLDPADAERLRRMRALRTKLRGAFASVHPRPEFAERLRAAVLDDPPRTATRHRGIRFWQVGIPLAAAAVLVFGIVLALPSSSAQARLAELHHQMMADPEALAFHAESDPALLQQYFESQSQMRPEVPGCDCAKVTGGCIPEFLGAEAVGYAIERDGHELAVVVINRTPEELRLSHRLERNGREVWACAYEDCHIAAVRLGDYTYCVVGEVPHETLFEVVDSLIRAAEGDQAACTPCPFAAPAGV